MIRRLPSLVLLALPGCAFIDVSELEQRLDWDGDGWADTRLGGQDCDDADPAVHPGADEVCNGRDDDCDDVVDEDALDAPTWYQDRDGDGYGDDALSLRACTGPEGYAAQGGDCDDLSEATWPGAEEIWDGQDNDCDGEHDEGLDPESPRDIDRVCEGSWLGAPWSQAGLSVAGGPDLTGDGSPDVAFGAPGVGAGQVLVFTGPHQGEHAASQATAVLVGDSEGDWTGQAMDVGDVDLDGHADLVVGAPGDTGDPGLAYLVLGPITGRIELADADLRWTGVADARLGGDVCLLGDFDGAGALDLALASTDSARGAVWGGEVAVVDGATGEPGLEIWSTEFQAHLGVLARLGDTDGDGLDDLGLGVGLGDDLWLVRGPLGGELPASDLEDRWSTGEESYGSLEPFAAGDLDGDGLADVGILDTEARVAEGSTAVYLLAGSASGGGSVQEAAHAIVTTQRDFLLAAAAGDVDGDGRVDLLLGDPLEESERGAVFIAHGPVEGAVSLHDLPTVTFRGPERWSLTGIALAPADDLDEDGLPDLLVGSPELGDDWSGGVWWLSHLEAP